MALQKVYINEHGHTDTSAYCSVGYVLWLTTEAVIEVLLFKDLAAKTALKEPKRLLYRPKNSDVNWATTMDLTNQEKGGNNIVKCAYLWLKDHADFVGASDV